ncbi:MAG: hypothetical protein ACREP8_15880 [Candidatus Binatia bacterium]
MIMDAELLCTVMATTVIKSLTVLDLMLRRLRVDVTLEYSAFILQKVPRRKRYSLYAHRSMQ